MYKNKSINKMLITEKEIQISQRKIPVSQLVLLCKNKIRKIKFARLKIRKENGNVELIGSAVSSGL